jgi:hypothetical protein
VVARGSPKEGRQWCNSGDLTIREGRRGLASSIGTAEPPWGGEKNTVSYDGPHEETTAARGVAARWRSAQRDGMAHGEGVAMA